MDNNNQTNFAQNNIGVPVNPYAPPAEAQPQPTNPYAAQQLAQQQYTVGQVQQQANIYAQQQAQQQYAQPQYAQPQYTQPQYAQPQYAQPQQPQAMQFGQPQQPQYAAPQMQFSQNNGQYVSSPFVAQDVKTDEGQDPEHIARQQARDAQKLEERKKAAITAMIFGLVGFGASQISLINFFSTFSIYSVSDAIISFFMAASFSVVGIVFGALGKNKAGEVLQYVNVPNRNLAVLGRVFGIIGLVFGIIMTVINFICIIAIA